MVTHEELEDIYDVKCRGVRVAAPRIKIKGIIRNAGKHDNVYDHAAFLLRKLITAHYFEDANKRTAWVTTRDYLRRHGIEPAETKQENTEPVLKAIRAFEVEELSEWLETGTIDERKFNPGADTNLEYTEHQPILMSESQHDDFEEHRKRIRELIEEDRNLLDALAGLFSFITIYHQY